MKTLKVLGISVLFLVSGLSGVVRAENTIVPDNTVTVSGCPVQRLSNDQVEVTLAPVRDEIGPEWMAFRLSVENKTDQELRIVWDDTFYLRHGRPDGRFRFGGEPLFRGVASRAPDVVPPNGTFSRVIWPEARFHYSGPVQGWTISPMSEGEHGISLAVRSGGQDFGHEQLALNIDQQVHLCGLPSSRQAR